jgi:diguanylate cyclase (GGDEF)-like protein
MRRATPHAAAGLGLIGLMLAAQWALAADLAEVARNVQFTRVTSEHGLSSEFVHDVAQDRTGYIWFATQSGLNRFDGNTVRVYEHRSDEQTALSHNFVWSLHVDPDGRLLVGTDRGINAYRAATDDFDRTPFGGALADFRIRKMVTDTEGNLWVGTRENGLVRVARDSGTITVFGEDDGRDRSLPSNRISDLYAATDGTLWVGTDSSGLARFNPGAENFTLYRSRLGDDSSLGSDNVRSILEDREGRLWIGTEDGGVSRYDRASGGFIRYRHDDAEPYSIASGQVLAMFEDRDGTLWIGTENGLSEWRPSLAGFLNYRHDATNTRSLVNDRVNAISQDASGVLWLATHGGVSAWNYVSDTFTYYAGADFLQSDVVSSLAQSSDSLLWVGTYGGGLSRIDLDQKQATHYRHAPDDPASLADDRVMTVHVDRNDRVWVGTRTGGLSRLNDDGTFTHFRHDPASPDSLSGNAVSRIFSSPTTGDLWVGVYGGGLNRLRFDGERAGITRFRHDPTDEQSLSGDRVVTILEDADGALLVGTRSAGLNRLSPDTGRFERIDIDAQVLEDGTNPVNGTPWEMRLSQDGSLWIGTLSAGLMRWSASDRRAGLRRFERFDAAAGLPSDVYGIVEDSAGDLWLSSSRGVFRYSPANGAVRRFDRTNGLRDNEFNTGAALASAAGGVLFGGTAGLLTFHPAELPHNTNAPRIALTASSRSTVLERLSSGLDRALELGYRDPYIAFDFVALDFVSPDKNRYRYRLSGYDAEWNDAGTLRRAIYSNLPAGAYRFEVQASNSDGVWNRKGAAVEVTVAPPPWRSAWAYVAYAAAALALVIALARRQHLRRRQEAEIRERLEKLVQQRTSELAERNRELTQLNERLGDANDRLEEASVTDQLTGLRNRRFVSRYIEGEMRAVKRTIDEHDRAMQEEDPGHLSKMLCVLMIDLDGFKAINDRYGHAAGDLALVEVRNRLTGCCRASDTIVRWGGDEFLIFGRTNSFEGAQQLAEQVRRVLIGAPYQLGNGRSGQLSGSIGVTTIPFAIQNRMFCTWEQAVAVADHGAYLAKYNGRNGWVSIRGTDLFEAEDMDTITPFIEPLVDAGKVKIESSHSKPLELQITQLVRIQAAG